MDTENSTPNIQWAASQRPEAPVDMDVAASAPKLGFWNEAAPFVSEDEDPGAPAAAGRFTVLHVEEYAGCKVLVGRACRAVVRGGWAACSYRAGMRVRVYDNLNDAALAGTPPARTDTAGTDGGMRTYLVDDAHNAVLIEDDVLPVTCFCTALECVNNPLLSRMVADISFDYAHPAAVLGKIVHEIIQACVAEKASSLRFIVATARRLLCAHETELYASNVSAQALLNEILGCVRHIVRFLEMRLDIAAAEHGVLSRGLGLRGYIDCYGPGLVVEIKTGKAPQVCHRAQLLLYVLLVLEGEGALDSGGCGTARACRPMLYYVRSGELVVPELRYSEIAPLLQLRNRVASAGRVVGCDCPETRPCRVYGRIQGLGRSHFLRMQLEGIEEECRAGARYLKAVVAGDDGEAVALRFAEEAPTCSYLSLYSRTRKHMADGVVARTEGRTVHVRLRERLPRDRVVYACVDRCDVFFRYMRWSLIHLAYPKYFEARAPGALRGIRLPGEGCAGDDGADVGDDGVDDSAEDSSFDSDAVFSDSEAGAGSAEPSGGTNIDLPSTEFTTSGHFCSGDSVCSDFSLPMDSTDDVELSEIGAGRKRPQIAFNHADVPSSADVSADTQDGPGLWTQLPEACREEFGRLNDGQRRAIAGALDCECFSTVHGMPGTGKSTLISLLIKMLVFREKRVLVVCYTHFAIDNIIKKLGGLRHYRANWGARENIGEAIASAQVVLGTCFCFGDPVFVGSRFDFCIIDEGSQMHLLLALIPVSLSERVCVVGDHLQLKPLAKRSAAMRLSIFEHLMDGCSVLRRQYRMNDEIMRLSNTLFYGLQLVGTRGPARGAPVVFVDTDRTPCGEAVRALGQCTVLCYFNSTVRELRTLTACNVTTIDRFQGSEDSRVAVVFDPVTPCEVVESRERLNVALTRARDHLTLIGSRSAMAGIGVLRELLDIL